MYRMQLTLVHLLSCSLSGFVYCHYLEDENQMHAQFTKYQHDDKQQSNSKIYGIHSAEARDGDAHRLNLSAFYQQHVDHMNVTMLTDIADHLRLEEWSDVISSWADEKMATSTFVNSSSHVLAWLSSVVPYADVGGYSALSSKRKNLGGQLPVISAECIQSVKQLVMDLFNKEAYAEKFLDAFGKLPSGVAQGDFQWIGSYDECNSIRHSHMSHMSGNHSRTIEGKYCMLAVGTVQAGWSPTFNFGFCVPDQCEDDDVFSAVDNLLDTILTAAMYKRASPVVYCRKDNSLHPSSYCSIVFMTIVVSILLFGIIYDLTKRVISLVAKPPPALPVEDAQSEVDQLLNTHSQAEEAVNVTVSSAETTGRLQEVAIAFSPWQNGAKILSTSVRGGDSFLGMLNGMRVLSMWWVIFGHSVLFQMAYLKNLLVVQDLMKRFTFQVVMQGTFSVDSFFFLSGLLVSYLTLKQLQRHDGSLNWFLFYFHRIWRLTPLYMFVLIFFMGIFSFLLDGPWTGQVLANPTLTSCYKYWWANLLYINNFVPGRELNMCMGWSWYLANDMQFFVISPIFIYLLYRWRMLGIITILLTLLCSLIMTGVMASVHNTPGIMLTTNITNIMTPYNDYLYIQPFYRISPYLVGIVLGYIFYKTNGVYRLHWIAVISGWCLSALFGLLIIYGFYHNFHDSVSLQPGIAAWYTACSRCTWALVIGWVCFACAHGYGGAVNRFLSWRAWSPLSRLTYAAYLVHPIVMMLAYTQNRVPIYYTDVNTTYGFIGNLVVSYAVAFVASILVESPMMALEKILFAKWR